MSETVKDTKVHNIHELIKNEPVVLEQVWADRAKELLDEEIVTREEKIQELRRLAKRETELHLPEEDDFYLLFLRGGKMNPVTALEIVKSYFLLRLTNPQYFKV